MTARPGAAVEAPNLSTGGLREMQSFFWSIVIGIVLLIEPNVSYGQGKPSTIATQGSQSQIDKLRNQVDGLRKEIDELKKTISDVSVRAISLEMQQNAHKNVGLDLTSHNFERVDTDLGFFLVSVREADQYLDGYRVLLDVGNPSYATYNGMKITVKWNRSYDWSKYTAESLEAWNKAIRNKEITLTDQLRPGAWNKVEVILPSTKGDELGSFVISMDVSSVVLYKTP
jgi:hypothetical protein